MAITIGDKNSALFTGLSGFWTRFFRDTADLEAFYQASEIYLGQAYLDLMAAVLNIGIEDTPVFNRESWKLILLDETQVNYVEGASIAEDRYVADLPSTAVSVDFLQNTIFSPDVLLERGVDFFVTDDDGYVRFIADPFAAYQDSNGEWMPTPGVAWRTIQREVGNQFTDREREANWVDDTDVKRGDTLRLLGHRGVLLDSDVNGAVTIGLGSAVFSDVGVGGCKVGDILHVYQSVAPDTALDGYYVVKQVLGANQILLEETFYLLSSPSTTALKWSLYRGMYFTPYRDYECDYYDKLQIVGSSENPYPTDLNTPVVYAVVRTPADPEAVGVAIVPQPIVAPFTPVDLGYKHIVPGSLVVYAKALGGGVVVEGVDYTVDLWRGILTPLTAWDPSSYFTVDFEFSEEVLFAAGGEISAKTVGRVKQLSLWTPEVLVDRFVLADNYGSLVGRWAPSSENYKAFLRGIFFLYVSGPIFERIESALDLAAGYPLIKNDGEILQGYDDGIDGTNTDGVIVGASKYFSTVSYTFTTLDVGGYVIVSGSVNPVNNDKFRINTLINATTVELESSYPLVNEVGLDWIVTREYKKTVTTDQRVYEYPFNVPMRADVQVLGNFGLLTFKAFESLTLAFQVTDYLEESQWWVNKTIPRVLWTDAPPSRRLATPQLVPHVIGPLDGACIGDPGLMIGMDDAGNVSPVPVVPGTCTTFRHTVAFLLFDRFVKLHMFNVEIDAGLELDPAWDRDLRELVLICKPCWTYPYIAPSEAFTDTALLGDTCGSLAGGFMGSIGLHWGPEETLELVHNQLLIGDPDAPWTIGAYHRTYDVFGVNTGIVLPVTPATPFVLPINLPPVLPEQRVIGLNIQATIGGLPVREGLDYLVDWQSGSATAWTIFPLTSWDIAFPVLVDMTILELDNLSVTLVPNTIIGFAPYVLGGQNPGTIGNRTYSPAAPPINHGIIDRALCLKVNANTMVPGTFYIYS